MTFVPDGIEEIAGPAFPTTTERGGREGAARSNVRYCQSSPLLNLGIFSRRSDQRPTKACRGSPNRQRRRYSSSLTLLPHSVTPPLVSERCIIGESGRAPCQ